MRKWTKTAGLIFLAAASVYSYQAIEAASGSGAVAPASAATNRVALAPWPASDKLIAAPAEGATDVKLLDEATDPFASGPTTAPSSVATTQGADKVAGASPTSQPSEGRSVSNSEVSVSDAGTVEIHVNDANLVEVLRMLSLQSQKNIIASKDVHGTITANLYDVTVREALDAILHANGYAYREKGNFIYVYTTKEIEDIEKSEKKMQTQVFRVFYTPAADAAIMIKPVLSAGGGQVAVTAPAKVGIASAPTGGGGDSFANNDVLVVTDYPENIDAVRNLLADLDKRPQQILLEATILRADLNDDNSMGVDFNILGGADFTKVFNSSGQLTGATATPDAGNPNAHSVGTGNSFSSPINGGFKVGYVSDSISVFLSALEQVTDTTVLANPKVLALNKQQGEVFVGNEDGYYTTLTTETTTSQSVESLKTGTRLIFRPFIANDGYIRMEVHPEDSDGAVKANGLPSKSTTEVTSNVMIKDGHTIVIGGLFRESTIISKSQVPFLGNIPGAGLLFKNQKDTTKREEVIILLTPHIIKDDASYSRLSEEELKRTNDLRVGMRKGMMPWGRERLAEGWYDAAKREMAKPKPNRSAAKFDLDCATNLNPKFFEAIQLKEEITGHEVTAADNSSIRGFVRRSIVNDVTPSTMPTRTALEDADAMPSTQPTAAAPTSQPVATDSTSTWGDDQKTDLNDSAATEQAMTEATSRSPESAKAPAGAAPDSAEASVADESVAIPSTQPASSEKTGSQLEKSGSTTTLLPEEPSDASGPSKVITDPLASPASQPATPVTEKAQTVVTPLEDEVPGQIPTAGSTPETSK